MTTDLQLDGFLDDYFAECDEHLSEARQHLLTLEASLSSPGSERAAVDGLFRNFHSIKGISGMVELREAEQLAHEMESYLRALRQSELTLTAEGVDALIDGAQRLEEVVGARSREAAIPPIADLLSRLTALVPAVRTTSAGEHTSGAVVARGQAFRVTFRPSRERSDQAIGVDLIRRRIAEHGTILETVPRVNDDGSIEFVFIVTTTDVDGLESLRQLHATVERVAEEEAEALEAAAPPRDEAPALARHERASSSHYVRVELRRLDELMRSVGDLVISRARLSDSLTRAEARVPASQWRAIQENAGTIDRQLRTLREGIMRVRLVPIGEIFNRMPLVVRDLARSFGRRVELRLDGQGTEIDKYLIERMMDPVLHLVRNAIAHGIETPEERMAAGKTPQGTIHLSAATVGDRVTIDIADDGRGIDVDRVIQSANAAGVPVPPGPPTSAELLALVCAPGLSTRVESDRAAGRGVGMAVVKAAVEQLSGSMSLDTVKGQGTRFTVQLPITLAITDAIIMVVGTQTFAVPQGAVREVLEVDPSEVRTVEQHELVPHRQAALPLLRLARLFGIDAAPRGRLHVFVAGQDSAAVGFAVDRIVGQREVVVRPIVDPLVRVEGVSGATDLGDGRAVLILDPAALSRMARRQATGARPSTPHQHET